MMQGEHCGEFTTLLISIIRRVSTVRCCKNIKIHFGKQMSTAALASALRKHLFCPGEEDRAEWEE